LSLLSLLVAVAVRLRVVREDRVRMRGGRV